MKFLFRIFSVSKNFLFSGRGLHQDRSGKECREYREAGRKKTKQELSK